MATTYTASATIKCFKKHQCIHCSTRFGYEFKRKVAGSGGTKEAAGENLDKMAEATIRKEVDVEPCPVCGLIQPDMIAQKRRKRHGLPILLTFLMPLPMLLASLQGVSLLRDLPYSLALGIGAGIGAVVLAWHSWIARWNPNRKIEANQKKADAKIAEERIQVLELGSIPEEPSQLTKGGWSRAGRLALLLGLVGVLLAAVPWLLCATGFWKDNLGVFPGVVSEGSSNRYYFKQRLPSIKGYWTTVNASAVLVEKQFAAGNAPLQASGKTDDWGNQISVKKNEGGGGGFVPYVRVTFPELKDGHPDTLTLQIRTTVSYPQGMGAAGFANSTSSYQTDIPVALSPAGAGPLFAILVMLGSIAGPILLLVCGILLVVDSNALGRMANPTEVALHREEPGEETPADDADPS